MSYPRGFKRILFEDHKPYESEPFNWEAWRVGLVRPIASPGRIEAQRIEGGTVPGHTFDPPREGLPGLQNGWKCPRNRRNNCTRVPEMRLINSN